MRLNADEARINETELFDTVAVKNRVTDDTVKIVFDGKEVSWAPGEVRHLPRKYAEFFTSHSTYQWNPITFEMRQRLVILGRGDDESPLQMNQTQLVELLDRSDMDPTHFDDEGRPMQPEVRSLKNIKELESGEKGVYSVNIGHETRHFRGRRAAR